MHQKFLQTAVAGVLVLAAGTAAAATRTTTLDVSAVVNPNCLVGTTGAINFGSFDGSAAKTGSADVQVRCSNLTPYTVKLSAGTTSGATFAQRLLAGNGTNKLQYNLYTTSALSTIWGDGVAAGTGTMGGVGSGMSSTQVKTHTVFGQLPNSVTNQDAPTGTYTDTVTVTVEY
jgi:spore coat protein U-like protein